MSSLLAITRLGSAARHGPAGFTAPLKALIPVINLEMERKGNPERLLALGARGGAHQPGGATAPCDATARNARWAGVSQP